MSSSRKKWLMIGGVAVVLAALVAAYSLRGPARKPEIRRYPLTGLVVSVQPEIKRVTVANDNIPGFMGAMVMDYKLSESAKVSTLKRGDDIRATLVSDSATQWDLEDVTVTNKR